MNSRRKISDPTAFAESVRSGDRRSLARALTYVENRVEGFEDLLDSLYPDTGRAWRIGITGPPGAGKSTLAGALIRRFADRGDSIGYLGVDPTSPFSGGAVLGDRIRLDPASSTDVFVRSAASRGALGGLSAQSESLADVLDAAGFDIVFLESVGVGQAELDIVHSVDSTVVVLVPESGDEIQTMKAGLLEIADILCVNKSDRQSADVLLTSLEQAVSMRAASDRQLPEIVSSIGVEAGGERSLFESLNQHRDRLLDTGAWENLRDARLRRRVREIVRDRWLAEFWTSDRTAILDQTVNGIEGTVRRPYSLASAIIDADVEADDDGDTAGSP